MVQEAAQLPDDYEIKRIPRPNELKKGELPVRPEYRG